MSKQTLESAPEIEKLPTNWRKMMQKIEELGLMSTWDEIVKISKLNMELTEIDSIQQDWDEAKFGAIVNFVEQFKKNETDAVQRQTYFNQIMALLKERD